jgi:hypothetical protein
VYLREGHQRFLEATGDKRQPPWAQLRGGRRLRHAEPCRVVDVQYVVANDGSDHTLAQLTLSFSDADSPLKASCSWLPFLCADSICSSGALASGGASPLKVRAEVGWQCRGQAIA